MMNYRSGKSRRKKINVTRLLNETFNLRCRNNRNGIWLAKEVLNTGRSLGLSMSVWGSYEKHIDLT